MKKYLIMMVAMVVATMSYAQNSLVATLTHGDEIKMFYGIYALQKAHAAAANGDIINLSGGGFQAVNITKALTIRGTGITASFPTSITGVFQIAIPNTVTERLNFEGCIIADRISVKGTLTNAYFLKSRIESIYAVDDNKMVNCTFVNCIVWNTRLNYNSTVQYVNSFVRNFYSLTTSSATFINCVVYPGTSGDSTSGLESVQLINSIIFSNSSYNFTKIPSTSSAWNCVAVGNGNTSIFNNLSVKQNCTAADTGIFKNGNEWNDLTDEAKAEYLGTDGTPVGMYGGVMPYNMTPTYPRITKMNVASKTTADGKLSVEIEVSAAE